MNNFRMAAVDLVDKERMRQIEKEGWSLNHDDNHQRGELLSAGICYIINGSGGLLDLSGHRTPFEGVPDLWPFEDEWWKPKNPKQDLVRGISLVMAERDRRHRSGEKGCPSLEWRINDSIIRLVEVLEKEVEDEHGLAMHEQKNMGSGY